MASVIEVFQKLHSNRTKTLGTKFISLNVDKYFGLSYMYYNLIIITADTIG